MTGFPTRPLETPSDVQPFQHVVVLFFEPAAEARLLGLDAELRRHDLDTFPRLDNIRPHISLAAFTEPLPTQLPVALRNFATGAPLLVLNLSSLAFFPTEQRVAFLSPAPTSALLDLQAGLLGLLESFELNPNHYYQPGNWVPHCTIALDVDPSQIPLIETVCRQAGVFTNFAIASLGLVSYPPPELLGEFPLGSLSNFAPNTPPK